MKSQLTPSNLKLVLVSSASVAMAAALLMLIVDPTGDASKRLDGVDTILAKKERLEAVRTAKMDVAQMARSRLFVMTTGPNAYKEKTFQVLGISISPKRRAALLSVDGASPTWVGVGDLVGEAHLVDVGTNGVRFETPIGTKTVNLSDAPPAATQAPQ